MLIDNDFVRYTDGKGRTSSKLPSSAATSLRSLAPRTSVELIGAAILSSPLSNYLLHYRHMSELKRGRINMAPFVETWSARELEFYSQVSPVGKKRKGFEGNLKGCELLQMLQYRCEVEKPVTRESVTRCWPVERMFRR
jgi:hypothetical protein